MAATSSQQISVSAATPRSAPAPLTDQQKALIDSYLAAHPGRAQALAAMAARWKAFADAHPELAAELAKVAALPPVQRKQELSTWFAAHPDQKAVFEQWVKQTRQARAERRDDRRDRRRERRDNRGNGGASTPTPTPSTSSSALTTSALA
jgi:hemophore-related protein